MRTYRRLRVQLSKEDEKELRGLLQGGIQQVRVVLRALALLQLSAGQTVGKAAKNVELTSKAVREIGRRYEKGGLERALYEKQRRALRRCWILAIAKESLPWFAPIRRRGRPAGPCA
jgi:hypothetical protein